MNNLNQAASPSPPRRQMVLLSQDGLTYLRWQHPLIVVWWSAAFPGFGHFLLHQHFRGFFLSLWEVLINRLTHINEATVYSFSGRFELAKEVLDPRWLFAYMFVYLFAIWDSYLGATEANKLHHMAVLENARITPYAIRPLCISTISLRRPWAAMISSCILPGLGQLYNHRLTLGFYGVFWWMIYMTLSHSHQALLYLFHGKITEATQILNLQWLLFMPSVIGGAMYDAYMTTLDHNRLFRLEQRQFFGERYPQFQLDLFSDTEG
ncbi:hypothetical protein [Paenibacillus rigui]|nr:hypothetical protein [Paenibacillus rigui]